MASANGQYFFLLNIEIKINDIVVMPIDCEVNIHKQFKGQNQSVIIEN